MSILKLVKSETPWLHPPLDYSFKQLSSELDLAKHKPRMNRIGKLPDVGPNNKYLTQAVWLSNNSLQTTQDAAAIVSNVLEDPAQLAWLDLSFNQIYDIDEQLLQFRNLKILYLHGNRIQNLSALSILRNLPNLVTLTLHGNPVDAIPHCRRHVINMLPQVSNLDFSLVVESERRGVPPPGYFDHLKNDKKKPATK